MAFKMEKESQNGTKLLERDRRAEQQMKQLLAKKKSCNIVVICRNIKLLLELMIKAQVKLSVCLSAGFEYLSTGTACISCTLGHFESENRQEPSHYIIFLGESQFSSIFS